MAQWNLLAGVASRALLDAPGHEVTYPWGPMPSLVLRGERHTGTHFLAALLNHNFPSDLQSMHTEPTMAAEDCPVEVIQFERSEP